MWPWHHMHILICDMELAVSMYTGCIMVFFHVATVTTSNANVCLISLPKAHTKILILTARIFLRVLVRSVLLERFS